VCDAEHRADCTGTDTPATASSSQKKRKKLRKTPLSSPTPPEQSASDLNIVDEFDTAVTKKPAPPEQFSLHCDSSVFGVAYVERTITVYDAMSNQMLWTKTMKSYRRPILRCVLHVETHRVFVDTENGQLIQFNICSGDEVLIDQDIDIDGPDNFDLRVSHDGNYVVVGWFSTTRLQFYHCVQHWKLWMAYIAHTA
jgi:hypothetical protein